MTIPTLLSLLAHVYSGSVTLSLIPFDTLAPYALHALHDGATLLVTIAAHEALLLGLYAALRAVRAPKAPLISAGLTAGCAALSAPLWTPGLSVPGVNSLFVITALLMMLSLAAVQESRPAGTP